MLLSASSVSPLVLGVGARTACRSVGCCVLTSVVSLLSTNGRSQKRRARGIVVRSLRALCAVVRQTAEHQRHQNRTPAVVSSPFFLTLSLEL